MQTLYTIIQIILTLAAVLLVVLVLAQEGRQQGLGAIAGGAETFFGKSKGRTMEEKLKKYTRIVAVAFIVLSIALVILQGFTPVA